MNPAAHCHVRLVGLAAQVVRALHRAARGWDCGAAYGVRRRCFNSVGQRDWDHQNAERPRLRAFRQLGGWDSNPQPFG